MKRSRYFINSLEKGFSILSTFSDQKHRLTLTELARTKQMTLGTAHRYLLTLKELGFISQDEDKKYRLTPKVLSFGFSALKNMDLRTRVLPHMIKITKERDVTTQCAILEGVEIIYVERVRSTDVVNLDLTVGSRLPAYGTAMGKIILAFMNEDHTRKIIDQMNLLPLTPYTITNKKALWKELVETRRRGYAINNQELALGLRTLAAPIFSEGKVEAAIGVSFPAYRTEGSNFESQLVKEMLEIAQKVSL
jgi:IclR family transcriptional regulator, pca regulon regulatory protein